MQSLPIWCPLMAENYFVIESKFIIQLCPFTNHGKRDPLPQLKHSFTTMIQKWLNQLATKNCSWDCGEKVEMLQITHVSFTHCLGLALGWCMNVFSERTHGAAGQVHMETAGGIVKSEPLSSLEQVPYWSFAFNPNPFTLCTTTYGTTSAKHIILSLVSGASSGCSCSWAISPPSLPTFLTCDVIFTCIISPWNHGLHPVHSWFSSTGQ